MNRRRRFQAFILLVSACAGFAPGCGQPRTRPAPAHAAGRDGNLFEAAERVSRAAAEALDNADWGLKNTVAR